MQTRVSKVTAGGHTAVWGEGTHSAKNMLSLNKVERTASEGMPHGGSRGGVVATQRRPAIRAVRTR